MLSTYILINDLYPLTLWVQGWFTKSWITSMVIAKNTIREYKNKNNYSHGSRFTQQKVKKSLEVNKKNSETHKSVSSKQICITALNHTQDVLSARLFN